MLYEVYGRRAQVGDCIYILSFIPYIPERSPHSPQIPISKLGVRPSFQVHRSRMPIQLWANRGISHHRPTATHATSAWCVIHTYIFVRSTATCVKLGQHRSRSSSATVGVFSPDLETQIPPVAILGGRGGGLVC